MKKTLLLVIAALLLAGCGMLTGPNRMVSYVGNDLIDDAALFDGVLQERTTEEATPPGYKGDEADCRKDKGCQLLVVGYWLVVGVVDGPERVVWCARGAKAFESCRSGKILSRLSVRGRPMTEGIYEPVNIEWRDK